ncbi:MAG: hypothetical protein ACJ8HJ_31355 [Massilia sp.]
MRYRSILAGTLAAWCSPALARGNDGSNTLVGIVIILGGVYFGLTTFVKTRVERELNRRAGEIEAKEQKEREYTKRLAIAERAHTEDMFARRQAEILAELKAALNTGFLQGRVWVEEFIAEAFYAPDQAAARALESKKHPALKAASEVKRIAFEKKQLLQKLKRLEYALKTYHEYYPVLEQYHEDILNEDATLILEDDDESMDRVSMFISKEEYDALGSAERNQRALDNWKRRRKSNVEVGRSFERYLGYRYEIDGWKVTFVGATEGLADMGRDLLCTKGSIVHVVQAKYWAQHKTLHEKHIFQLYGTTVLLPLTHPELKDKSIIAIFAATTKLSDTALWAAKRLRVIVKNMRMDHDYPLIKCNVNGTNKIYHLPFDQQYDRVRIDPSLGETYVRTTAEAERLGFRRAMRHFAV